MEGLEIAAIDLLHRGGDIFMLCKHLMKSFLQKVFGKVVGVAC